MYGVFPVPSLGFSHDIGKSELRNHIVVLRIEVACPAPKLKGKPRPERCVSTIGIKVPARTARGPDSTMHPLLHFLIEGLLNLWPHLDGLQVSPIHGVQAIQDVGDL